MNHCIDSISLLLLIAALSNGRFLTDEYAHQRFVRKILGYRADMDPLEIQVTQILPPSNTGLQNLRKTSVM